MRAAEAAEATEIERIWGDPTYYKYRCSIFLEPATHQLAVPVALVEFATSGLEVPGTEPFGVVHYAGIRRYQWRDDWWTEYDLNANKLLERAWRRLAALQKDAWKYVGTAKHAAHLAATNSDLELIRMLKLFLQLQPPHPAFSGIFVRALTRIN